MGILNRNKNIKNLVNDLEYRHYSASLLNELISTISNEETLHYILEDLVKNERILAVSDIISLYENIVINGNKESIEIFKKFYNAYKADEWEIDNYITILSAFDDKKVAFEAVNNINTTLKYKDGTKPEISRENLNKLVNYLTKARQYYIDDRQLLSSFISLLDKNGTKDYLLDSNKDINKIISAKLNEDKRQNGIYDINPGTLAEINHKLDLIESSSSSIRMLIDTATTVISELKTSLKVSKDELVELKIKSIEELQNKATSVLENFNAKYLELLSTERESLSKEKASLIEELSIELENKRKELGNIVRDMGSSVSIELARITSATNSSVRKIEDFVNNNEKVKELIENTRDNDDFIEGLKKIGETIREERNDSSSPIIVPEIILSETEREVDNTINYFFDKSIPFSERFKRIQEIKNKNIDEGEIYHEKFDDILKLVMEGQAPYMYGPSGCGKTYMIEHQLAKLLNMNVITSGYIMYEQDIIGYTNSATGAYVKSNFYRCFKFGDISFLDELDNGIANATVVLNRFLGLNNTSYTFPDGSLTMRHPNFRIITSGNTNGAGRTLAHNTRQKLDESVMQRLTPIFVNYDNRVEKEILKDHLDWYYFAINFRKAVESIPTNDEGINTVGTFTTRDAETVKNYLDNKVFDEESIIQYEIIQTKDIDTLTRIKNTMNELDNQGEFKNNSKKLLRIFNEKVNERRN